MKPPIKTESSIYMYTTKRGRRGPTDESIIYHTVHDACRACTVMDRSSGGEHGDGAGSAGRREGQRVAAVAMVVAADQVECKALLGPPEQQQLVFPPLGHGRHHLPLSTACCRCSTQSPSAASALFPTAASTSAGLRPSFSSSSCAGDQSHCSG